MAGPPADAEVVAERLGHSAVACALDTDAQVLPLESFWADETVE